MLIGEAALKSAAFSPRLEMLLSELRAAGCTVWLEGLRLRFDRPDAAMGDEGDLETLFRRYHDVVEWLPEPKAEANTPRSPAPVPPSWRGARRADVKVRNPLHK